MPTYEYECTKCKHSFEAFQKMDDAPLTKCPRCRGKVRRLISPGAGFIFKGNGFYATDYKKKKEDTPSESKKPPQCPKANSCDSCEVNKNTKKDANE